MTGLPSRNFRSDFSDFLRGGHQPGNSPSPAPTPTRMPSTSSLQTPTRSKSRIPFLGRSRKKSSQLADSDVDVSDIDTVPPPHAKRDQPRTVHDERISVASEPSPSHAPPPATASPAASSSTSFLARLKSRPRSAYKSRAPLANGYTSDTLVPPSPSTRSNSFESTVSQAERLSRSTTPRQTQPTITVFMSPDNVPDIFMQAKAPASLPRSSLSHPPISPVEDTSSKRWSWKQRSDDASKSATSLPSTIHAKEKRKTISSISSAADFRSQSFNTSGSPTLPLPPTPPLSPLPPIPVPPEPAQTTVTRTPRPRAHTLSSVSSRSSAHTAPASPILEPARRSKSIHSTKSFDADAEGDLETASPELLRHIIRVRNQQVSDLTASLLLATQEKYVMEKKIASLEREAARREKEMVGLTWLVNNGGDAVTPKRATALENGKTPSSPSPSIKSPVMRRLDLEEDTAGSSGGESASSSIRTTRAKRSSRVASSRRSSLRPSALPDGPDIPLPDIPQVRKLDKRGSVSSFASSPTSSASSLFQQSNPSTSTLSAIPEGRPPVPNLPPLSISTPHIVSSSRDPAILAAISSRREKEQRRASAMKVSPKVSPAPTPAAAYAANLKKGGIASISQLLDAPVAL